MQWGETYSLGTVVFVPGADYRWIWSTGGLLIGRVKLKCSDNTWMFSAVHLTWTAVRVKWALMARTWAMTWLFCRVSEGTYRPESFCSGSTFICKMCILFDISNHVSFVCTGKPRTDANFTDFFLCQWLMLGGIWPLRQIAWSRDWGFSWCLKDGMVHWKRLHLSLIKFLLPAPI